MKILIRNGTVVTPTGIHKTDLLLADGLIAEVNENLSCGDANVIDASGKLLLPGGVDVHTHVTLNPDAATGSDIYFTATRAALMGGTTSIVEHMGFTPQGRSVTEQMYLYENLAAGQSSADYGFHGLIQSSDNNFFPLLHAFAERGMTSVKAYMTYAQRCCDGQLSALLKACAEQGILLAVHAEDHHCIQNGLAACSSPGHGDPIWHARSRPPECEAAAVQRLLRIAADAGEAPVYIVHLSTASALSIIRKTREAGQRNIFVETCTQYLTLTEDRYSDPVSGVQYILSPPLRKQEDVDALWAGLRDGHIQTVATDHCSFSLAEKNRGLGDFTRCPGGAPGIEERVALLFSEGVGKGRISLERFVEVMSANPAKLMGLYPRKGALQPGADADIIMLDPQVDGILSASNLHGPWGYTLYEGVPVKGSVEMVFLRGTCVVHNGFFLGQRGDGSLLYRQRFMEAH